MEMNYNEETLRSLERELDVEILPGTEIMVDVGSHHFVKASGSSDDVLVPQPSDDPNDPLNWSPLWKTLTLTNALLSTFSQGFGPLALAPMFGFYIEDFNSNLSDVVQFVGVCILVLGFSNLFWVPISSRYGRRPVLIASGLVCLASCIWRAEAKTYGSFMGACAVNGFGAGPAETIAPSVIADMFFLQDRGKYNTMYFAVYFGSLMVGPIVAGPMATQIGWRSFWWLNVGLFGFSTISLLVAFPETKWHRMHPFEMNDAANPSPSTKGSLNERTIGIAAHEEQSDELEMSQVDTAPDKQPPNIVGSETARRDPFLGRGTPSKGQFKLWQAADSHSTLWTEISTPWKLFAFPIVEFASFVVSWTASCFLTINLTQSQNFAAPPYNYSATIIGFFNFAILVGALIGLVTAGPLSDWISMKLTRRNNGIREPEMRLLAMIPYVLIMVLGNVITAIGYEKKWSWKVIVIIGYTCAGIQVAALPAIASTYAVDSYKPVAGAIFVTITINKNLWGYGFSKFVTPWILSAGYIPPIMTNMALTLAFCLSGILFWYKGKTFRRWSKNSKVHKQ